MMTGAMLSSGSCREVVGFVETLFRFG